jgi:hypothetical protein
MALTCEVIETKLTDDSILIEDDNGYDSYTVNINESGTFEPMSDFQSLLFDTSQVFIFSMVV